MASAPFHVKRVVSGTCNRCNNNLTDIQSTVAGLGVCHVMLLSYLLQSQPVVHWCGTTW
jgi:hypothetical protein